MGLQEHPTRPSGLFLVSMLQIIGMMKRRKFIVENIFDPYFSGVLTKEGWYKIKQVIEPHTDDRVMPTANTPSKPERQGDGTGSQFTINKTPFNLAMMYNTALSLGIIKVPQAELLRIDYDNTGREYDFMTCYQRWMVILNAYEQLYEMEKTLVLFLNSIKPLYRVSESESLTKSGGQLMFYGSLYVNGNLIERINEKSEVDHYFRDEATGDMSELVPHSFIRVPWNTFDVFSEIMNVILSKSEQDLWYIPIPTVDFKESSVLADVYIPDNIYNFISDKEPFNVRYNGWTPKLITDPTLEANIINEITFNDYNGRFFTMSLGSEEFATNDGIEEIGLKFNYFDITYE